MDQIASNLKRYIIFSAPESKGCGFVGILRTNEKASEITPALLTEMRHHDPSRSRRRRELDLT
jgi:hypothetical protein